MKKNSLAMNFVNQCFDDIKYPHTFNRRPQDLSSFDKWKASELRICMIYILLPVFIKLRLNILNSFPEVYLSHFMLLFIYIRVLRFYTDKNDLNDMSNFIHSYLYHFPDIYDPCKELYSTHALFHLLEQVKLHGGLAFHR